MEKIVGKTVHPKRNGPRTLAKRGVVADERGGDGAFTFGVVPQVDR